MAEAKKMIRINSAETHKLIKLTATKLEVTMEELIRLAVNEYVKNNG